MLEFLYTYGLFLAKFLTGAIIITLTFAALMALRGKAKQVLSQGLEVKNLNAERRKNASIMLGQIGHGKQHKAAIKELSNTKDKFSKTVYVIDFKGDLRARNVSSLREEISAILSVASEDDQVVLRLENAGGVVHDHGLAASQLARLRQRNVSLTICVDKVAASGGYLMAAVANKIYAAPFALIGSIGALAQLPNVHDLLEKHGIHFEQIQAGEHKRSLTVFGKNTDADRAKVQEDLDILHALFKQTLLDYRPQLDISKVATGDVWFGRHALDLKLVDQLSTSDDLLEALGQDANVYHVHFKTPTASPIGKWLGKNTARLLKY